MEHLMRPAALTTSHIPFGNRRLVATN